MLDISARLVIGSTIIQYRDESKACRNWKMVLVLLTGFDSQDHKHVDKVLRVSLVLGTVASAQELLQTVARNSGRLQ